MDIIYIRCKDGEYDSGYLRNFSLDCDISSDIENPTNDFTLKMPLPDSREGLYYAENEISTIFFKPGTEYGGEIRGTVKDTAPNEITYTGRTWRGMLEQRIIEPPEGEDYLVVSGNIKDCIEQFPLPDCIEVAPTAYSSESFQVDRYISTLKGIVKLLANVDPSLRFRISYEQDDGAYTGAATLRVGPTRDLTSLIEASQDYSDKIRLKITRDYNTPRHLICLGQGELHEREVIHLYADEDWNITTEPIPDAYPVDTYDYSSSENLLSDSLKHYAEVIKNHTQIEVSISDLEVQLGDIISAKDNLTEETVTAEIVNIIYNIVDNGEYATESYQYKTKVRL